MPDKPTTSQKGKSGILSSVRASKGALSLSGETGQCTQKDRSVRATRWMAVTNDDKLSLLLLVGREELQKLLQTLHQVRERGTCQQEFMSSYR